MRLDVSKALVAEGCEIPFALEVPLSETTALAEKVEYPVPARLSGFYASVGESITVRGKMEFVAKSRCVACLTEVAKPMDTAFDAVFALTPDPNNPDLYIYDGAWVDLSEMADDAAQLALPMRWLCGKDCKGLCPVCGANKNETLCSCRIEGDEKHPFSALQQLLIEDEREV